VRGVARAYVDTSVISALFDERNPERRRLTEMFFARALDIELFISNMTISEIDRTPDDQMRRRMFDRISRCPSLEVTEVVTGLADEYVHHGAVPERSWKDAYHIAIAVAHDMDFLLSWNFKHIVRRKTREIVRSVNVGRGLGQIEILTPAELL
jgi:predicted nucleic acid-binding protein